MASRVKTEEVTEVLPQEMMQHTYPILYQVEESHWWHIGRRRIIDGFVARVRSDAEEPELEQP